MTKEEVLNTINIADVYSHYFPEIQKRTGNVNVCSPFREESNPSFSINLDNGLFYDYADSNSGDIFKFVQSIENLTDFKTTLEFMSDRFCNGFVSKTEKVYKKAVKLEAKPIPAEQIEIYVKNLQNCEPRQIYEIFKERKIDLDLCRQLSIGAGVVTFRKDDKYIKFDTVIIPFEFDDQGNAIKYKKIPYLNKEKQSAYIRNTQPAVLFPNQFLEHKELVLCEGELDVLGLISHGINAITGTAGAGTLSNASNKEFFEQLANKEITILYDNDEPGQNHAQNTAANLTHQSKVKVAKWDRNKKGYDVGDFFSDKRAVPDLLHIINNAEPYRSKKDFSKLRTEISTQIYSETKSGSFNLMQNILVDWLYDTFYRDSKGKLILASSIEGAKRYFYLYSEGYWKRTNKEIIKAQIYKLLLHPFTNTTVDSIVSMLLSRVYIDYENFNARGDLINLNNCTYDLANFKQIPHDPEFYFSFKNEYDFDETANCPHWDDALRQYSANDPTWILGMWEIFGYSLTGKYDIQKMFWWEGPGGTGKSSTTRVLAKLVGISLTRSNFDPSALAGRFYKKPLIGKRIAITGDLDNYLMNINIIKQLTGGDRQTTDVKGSDEIEFENTAKIIFCMNTLPTIPSNESIQPFLRRIYLLPFHKKLAEYQPDVEYWFEQELSGIFNKAIIGLKRLRTEIRHEGTLIKKRNEFTRVKAGEDMLRFYEKNVNMFESFCDDRIIIDKDGTCFNWQIWDEYKTYMDERAGMHWDSDKINVRSITHIGARIKNKYNCPVEYEISSRENGKRGRYSKYFGIRLATDSDFPESEEELINRIKYYNENGIPEDEVKFYKDGDF